MSTLAEITADCEKLMNDMPQTVEEESTLIDNFKLMIKDKKAEFSFDNLVILFKKVMAILLKKQSTEIKAKKAKVQKANTSASSGDTEFKKEEIIYIINKISEHTNSEIIINLLMIIFQVQKSYFGIIRRVNKRESFDFFQKIKSIVDMFKNISIFTVFKHYNANENLYYYNYIICTEDKYNAVLKLNIKKSSDFYKKNKEIAKILDNENYYLIQKKERANKKIFLFSVYNFGPVYFYGNKGEKIVEDSLKLPIVFQSYIFDKEEYKNFKIFNDLEIELKKEKMLYVLQLINESCSIKCILLN